jgi:hypothetical protein
MVKILFDLKTNIFLNLHSGALRGEIEELRVLLDRVCLIKIVFFNLNSYFLLFR